MTSPTPPAHRPDKQYWLDAPQNVNKLVWLLVAVCTGLVLFDALYAKHGHFAFEESFPVFYGVFGFLAYCFIVLSAKTLRQILKRDEDYYDR
ncbi:MAG: hypothetical protein H6974_10395 [Gammaproteobacteria bacterium]|nr:hypothetical protein [Gammaproteobacteria bacterium]